MAGDPTITHKLDRALNALQQSQDKSSKRSALGDLKEIISKTGPSELGDLYARISKSLNLCFQDRFELCREQSILITIDVLNALEPLDLKHLVSLVPALQRRIISTGPSVESSEEIRLLLVKLLRVIIGKYAGHVKPFTEDIVDILTVTIADSAPEVKKESCSCALALSKLASHEFYQCSPKLIEPLVGSMSHQHWRVRAAVVETIGSVIQNGDNKCVPDVTTPLATRLFDDSHNVRMAVTRVVGNWLINLPDRYSFFPVLLPLILSGLTDENDDIVKETEFLWTAAGKQYLIENEKDYKDRIDYTSDTLEHYPANVTRPHLGCRALVEREGGKFLLALGREICDWVVSVRIKSAQLLVQVVLHVEASVTQQLHKIIGPMCKAAMDEEPSVVNNVILAAEYIGHFVPALVHCKLIVETMKEANYGELRIVSGLVRGSEREQLVGNLSAIGPLLASSTFKDEEQIAMLTLIESVFSVCGHSSLVIGEDIFFSIIAVAGMAANEDIFVTAQGLFNKFCRLNGEGPGGDGERSGVVGRYCGKTLGKLDEPSAWTVHCHHQYILDSLVINAGEVISQNLETILSILRKALGPDSDPEAVLKTMMAINRIIAHREVTLPNDDTFNIFINALLTDILKEELKWKAGRSAEAIRTAATSCLFACLLYWRKSANRGPNSAELVQTEIVPITLSLLEDCSTKTRSMAAKSLATLAPMVTTMPLVFSDVVLCVLKRLDDCDKTVRQEAVNCVQCLYKELGLALKGGGPTDATVIPSDSTVSQPEDAVSQPEAAVSQPDTAVSQSDTAVSQPDTTVSQPDAAVSQPDATVSPSDASIDNGLLEFVYTTLLVHLDDQDPNFQLLVLDALKTIAGFNMELLKRKINISNFRDKEICELLLAFLETC